ncbi:hypothetical protein BGX28_010518 [Mortierella sp. GBA30]|nr:hypothetical protein BGX28_010518 [Mortierella sp. GBA30]
MHKTTRQIWTSSSSCATSCFFCDLQLLLARPNCPGASTARVVGSRTWTRNKNTTTNTTRIQLQQVLQQKSLTFCSSASALSRQPRPHRQGTCTYTTRTLSVTTKREGSIGTVTALQEGGASLKAVGDSEHQHALLGSDATPRIIGSATRTSLQINSRFLSTSTSTSIAPDPEAELSSSSTLASVTSILTTLSPNTPSSPILTIKSATEETSTTAEFHSLFPETLTSFAESSQRDPFATKESRAPWRNSSMSPGSELEEHLRKSIYQRQSIDHWWPLYEGVADGWRSSSRSLQGRRGALVRTDFVRIIGALKVTPASTDPQRLAKLEHVFDDFHTAVNRPKSNVKVYDAFLETLHFWKMDEQIPEWVQRMKSKIVATVPSKGYRVTWVRQSSQDQYHDLMSVLAHANQTEEMLKCLEELKSARSDILRPTVKAYDTVLELFMKNKDTVSAMRTFQEMQDQGLEPHLTTFNILLRGHLENRDALSTQRVFESLLLTDIRPDIYTFNLLMSGYLNMGEIELVNGFYKSLGEYGLVPNAKTYRILMKSHLRQGQATQAINLFCRLKESSQAELQPGPEDYRVLIQVFASQGRMPDALRVLREMTETAKVPVTTSIYNVFLTQYARDGEIEKARRILDKIIAEKLPLADGSINPLIRTYLAQKDLDKVGEMTELMNQYGILPSRTTFNIMIDSTKASGNLEGAMRLYERMGAEGVEPDVWTYNTLLDLLVGKLSPAQDNVKRKGDASAVTEDQIAEYVPKIETLLQEMKARGIKPDVVTYGKLIQQYVVLGDIEQAETLFHEMVKSGISPNAHVFNMLMNGFTLIEEMDKAVELFRRMPKYGVEPDAVTFTTLIKGYINAKQMTLAQDFANALQHQESSSKIQMDQYCFHTLMQLAQKSHKPGMALDFFEMMRGRGMEPDNTTFTILINTLSRNFASSKSKVNTRSRGRRTAGENSVVGNRNTLADSTLEAVESILGIIQQDGYPLHHAEITTMISAYFRLGRPIAAIEFFKSSFWRGNPKLSTTNCGALFNGLLAPEHGKQYDGVVLNLYLRMLEGTKAMIRAKEEERERKRKHALSGSDNVERAVEQVKRESSFENERTSWTSSSTPMMASSASSTTARTATIGSTVSRHSRVQSEVVTPHDLPVLDLITINILMQSFSQRNNWAIVLQLWHDLESVGAENLYPFEMPLEFLGWAAQAYQLTPDHNDDHVSSSRAVLDSGDKKGPRLAETTSTQRQLQPGETNVEKSEKLLRRLWNAHHWMGISWSYKIHGRNIFGSLTPAPSSLSVHSTPAPSHTNSLLSSFLSGDASQPSYRGRPANETDVEGKKEEEEEHPHQQHQQQHHS